MVRLASIASAGLIALTACAYTSPPVHPPAPTSVDNATAPVPDYQTSYTWIPNQVLDLNSTEGTFVRASVESFDRSQAANDANWGYRGYRKAAPRNIDLMLLNAPSDSRFTPVIGDEFFSLIHLVRTRTNTTRAIICEYTRQAMNQHSNPPEKWTSVGIRTSHHILEFTQAGSPPPTNMTGPNRAPSRSPFGDWYANDYKWISMGDPEDLVFIKECDERRPKEVPQGWAGEAIGPTPAFTPVPSSPGWPG